MSQSQSSRGPATLSDVAEAANVSRMTVSKVLRGTGRISAATRQRVTEIADAMGYVPSSLAGALSQQSSSLVGVLIPSVSDQVYSGVLAGINAVLTPRGYSSLIGETFFDGETEERLVRMMLSMKPAGLILAGICLEAGFSRACYVGAQLERDLCAARRRDGFVAELARAGVACQVLEDPELTRTAEGGQILTERLLRAGDLPQVIHYLNDAMAIGGLRSLFAAGLSVPEAVSVIGFNGTSLQNALRTRLTTFEVPVRRVGEAAACAAIGTQAEREAAQAAEIAPVIVRGNTFRWPARGAG